jgi:hypothetical protein
MGGRGVEGGGVWGGGAAPPQAGLLLRVSCRSPLLRPPAPPTPPTAPPPGQMNEDEGSLTELCLTWQRQLQEAAWHGGQQEPRMQYSACPESGGEFAPREVHCGPARGLASRLIPAAAAAGRGPALALCPPLLTCPPAPPSCLPAPLSHARRAAARADGVVSERGVRRHPRDRARPRARPGRPAAARRAGGGAGRRRRGAARRRAQRAVPQSGGRLGFAGGVWGL